MEHNTETSPWRRIRRPTNTNWLFQGRLISLAENDTISMWSIKESPPHLIQSLRFKREKISQIYSPFDSKVSLLNVTVSGQRVREEYANNELGRVFENK